MEQFTKKAASALKLAAKAARRRNHSYIGSEHLLLGLLEEGEGTAAQVLIGAGVEEEKLKSLIDQLIAPEGGVGLASRRVTPPELPRSWKTVSGRQSFFIWSRREPSTS